MPPSTIDRNRLWSRLTRAVGALPAPPATPAMVVDLDAFDTNATDLARRAGGTSIRVATKSLRVPALIRRVLDRPGFAGTLCYTLGEALWLYETGVSDDLVVGYPTVDRPAIGRLLDGPAAAVVTLMIDDVVHLDLIDAQREGRTTEIRIAVDIDAGLRLGNQHVGPKRSPLYDARAVARLADTVADRPGFRLVGVMTYEGQVAGVPDDVPGEQPKSFVVRRLKQASMAQLKQRRHEIAAALTGHGLEFWNAGGSGSLAQTAADPVVTELAAGSGLLVPGLFDHYRSFDPLPAAYVGLPVTRRPSPSIATVHGGGFVASGPAGTDRLPIPWAPPHLHLTGLEGAGEVQTPVTGPSAALLRIGDLVWFRHAKSGEVFEHAREVYLLSGDRVTETVPTYRGLGQMFG